MAITLTIDGLINDNTHWNAVNWHMVINIVSRLQSRIVKAVKQEDEKLIRGLQRLLKHSLAAKLLAVRRVTSNRGIKTSGVDRVKLNTPKAKWQEAQQLNQRDYTPKPLKRIYIPKKNGKKRPLGIPTQKDRCEQALELSALDPIAECTADKCSNGFRKKRCVQDAIDGCYNALRLKGSAEWILEGDIKGCFDNINHDWMLQNVPCNKDKLRLWLKAGYMEKSMFYPTTAGTPQGGIASPTLANTALDGLEKMLNSKFKKNQKIHIVRYADDFIITGKSNELLEQAIKPAIKSFLLERGLELSEEKTKLTNINDGFDFLGFNIRKYKGKLLTRPSKSAIKGIKEKIRKTFKDNKMSKTDNLIKQLNPIIRGWGNFYHHSAASHTFGGIKHAIWEMSWKWSKRRHPKKSLNWIKSKYYQRKEGRDWVFGERKGKAELFNIGAIPIQRHVKIKGEANPYDIEWRKSYFSNRNLRNNKRNIFESKQDYLWTIQEGNCPICRTSLDNDEQWHVHHLIPKNEGGSSKVNNLALLHETCHKQFHCLNSIRGILLDA
jgi:RNA-directed DNA polymerase